MTDESPPVTTKECKGRRRNTNVAIGLMTLLLAVVFVLPLLSLGESRRAADKADAVGSDFGAHEKAQAVHEEHLHDTLREIKTDIREMQTAVLNKLSEVAKAVNGK